MSLTNPAEQEIKNDSGSPIAVSGTISTGLSQPLTDTQLRASAVPVTANAGTNLNTSALALDATLTGGTQKTRILDSSGTGITSIADGAGGVGLGMAMMATNFIVSTNNSSTAQLTAGSTFTGTIETIFNQQAISLLLTSDQAGLLTLNQYIDLAGTRLISSWPFTVAAGVPYSRSFTGNGNYFNLTFKNNGGSTTTTLNINTAYGTLPATTNLGNTPISVSEINGTVVDQGSGVSSNGTQRFILATDKPAITTASVIATASGDTNVIPATSAKKIQLYWYNLQAKASNSAAVTALLKGTIGGVLTTINTGDYSASQPFAHSIGAGQRSILFDTNTPVLINLSGTQTVYFNGEYDLM